MTQDPQLAHIASAPNVSFEFFPPKTAKAEQSLWQALKRLEPMAPNFVSVTYGAGGSTRERTHATIRRIQTESGLTPAAHLTCVGADRGEVDDVARGYWDDGVRHIVALRGDPPEGDADYRSHPDGYKDAAELVAGLKRVGDFELSVACYPEIHPEAQSEQADIDHLKRKFDAGATRAISQFFFDPDVFLRFLDRARAAGIWAPIVPGILPITNFDQMISFAAKCGAKVPARIAHYFDGLEDDIETRKLIAAAVTAEHCQRLQEAGVNDFHFFTLNRADLTFAICHLLGLRARRSWAHAWAQDRQAAARANDEAATGQLSDFADAAAKRDAG